MEYYHFYRSWMYDRTYPRLRGLKPHIKDGVSAFFTYVFAQEYCRSEGWVKCLCLKCGCRNIISDPNEVKRHLEKDGFRLNYWVCYSNREILLEMNREASSSQTHVGVEIGREASSSQPQLQDQGKFNLIDDMIGDALGVNVTYDEPQDFDADELPNEEAQNFYQLLKEINIPLFEGSSNSMLSICVRLLATKSNWNVPNQCLEFFAKMMLDATPVKENMPTSYYNVKRMGLKVKKIDCCIEGCMLFYDNEFDTNNGGFEECNFSQSLRDLFRSKGIDRKQK
ncbi:unnamed protein product [Lathyrus sativus]|nr:unnamed protein product [Lathyrus sativus]